MALAVIPIAISSEVQAHPRMRERAGTNDGENGCMNPDPRTDRLSSIFFYIRTVTEQYPHAPERVAMRIAAGANTNYRAYSTARNSRITFTLISPGYRNSACMRCAMSFAS